MAGLKIFQIYQKNVLMKVVHREILDFFEMLDREKKILQKLLLCSLVRCGHGMASGADAAAAVVAWRA